MRVVWAGLVVVVQPAAPGGAPAPWARPSADHDLVLHQVTAWLSGLRQGAQIGPPLPVFNPAPTPPRVDTASADDAPLPGFYL